MPPFIMQPGIDNSPEAKRERYLRIPPFYSDHTAIAFGFHDTLSGEFRALRAEPADFDFDGIVREAEDRSIDVCLVRADGEVIYRTAPCVAGHPRRRVRCP